MSDSAVYIHVFMNNADKQQWSSTLDKANKWEPDYKPLNLNILHRNKGHKPNNASS